MDWGLKKSKSISIDKQKNTVDNINCTTFSTHWHHWYHKYDLRSSYVFFSGRTPFL